MLKSLTPEDSYYRPPHRPQKISGGKERQDITCKSANAFKSLSYGVAHLETD